MYSLVQWNWFIGVTGCTWVTSVRWRQRTNFTAPGCMTFAALHVEQHAEVQPRPRLHNTPMRKHYIHPYLILRSFLINVANKREQLCNSGDVQTDFARLTLLEEPSLRVQNRLLLFDVELHYRKRLGQSIKCRRVAAGKTLSREVDMSGRCIQLCSAIDFAHGHIEPESHTEDRMTDMRRSRRHQPRPTDSFIKMVATSHTWLEMTTCIGPETLSERAIKSHDWDSYQLLIRGCHRLFINQLRSSVQIPFSHWRYNVQCIGSPLNITLDVSIAMLKTHLLMNFFQTSGGRALPVKWTFLACQSSFL